MAEIDARIPMGYRPAKFELPSEVALRHANLANVGNRNVLQNQEIRYNNMQHEESILAQDRRARVEKIVRSGLPKQDVIAAVGLIDPEIAAKMQKSSDDQETAEQNKVKAQLEMKQKSEADHGRALASLWQYKDPEQRKAAWPSLRARYTVDEFYTKNPIGKQILEQIPTEYPGDDAARQMTAMYAPDLLSKLEEGARAEETARRAQDTADANAKHAEAAIDAANTRNADNIKSREKIAGMPARTSGGGSGKPGGLTPYQVEQASKKHDDLQTKEQALWAQVTALSEIVNTPYADLPTAVDDDGKVTGKAGTEYRYYIDPKNSKDITVYSSARMAELKSRIASLKGQAKSLAMQQKSLRQRHGFDDGEAAPEAETGSKSTYTEAEVRQRARASGRDENAAVQAARAAKLIQ